jgi:hypothetical protein
MKNIKVYGIITAIMIVVSTALWMLSGYIAYPTQAHKDVARQRQALTAELFQGEDLLELQATTNYDELEQSTEARYSTVADITTVIAQMVALIAMIAAAYWYVRKRRLGRTPIVALLAVVLVQGIIMSFITLLLSNVFYYQSVNDTLFISPVITIFGLLFSAGFTLAIAFVTLKITEWQFNRRYGFAGK